MAKSHPAAIQKPRFLPDHTPVVKAYKTASSSGSVGVVVGAGALAYIGSVKETGSAFPSNTARIVVGTAILAIGASVTKNTPLGPVVKWVAILMLISVMVRYVPSFSTTPVKVKGSK